jgi:hypothetical protein
MTHLLEKTAALIPAHLRDKAFVAGGAAADFSRATDIDIFMVGLHGNDAEIRNVVGGLLYDRYSLIDHRDDRKKEHYGIPDFQKMATVKGLWPVQIIAVKQATITELLHRFDITTHQVAFSLATKEQHTVDSTTAPSEVPRVGHVTYPGITMERLIRLCARYGHTPVQEDVDRLNALISGQEMFLDGPLSATTAQPTHLVFDVAGPIVAGGHD